MALPGWLDFIIVLAILLVIALAIFIIYKQLHARQRGLPAPPLNPFADTTYPSASGLKGWVNTTVSKLRNRGGSGSGAYEFTSSDARSRGRSGFGPLDPDEAWDARVATEADYEEQELGLHSTANIAYSGAGYRGQPGLTVDAVAAHEDERGRSRSRQRDLDVRYDEETGARQKQNPFGEGAERSELRGVSPRPHDDGKSGVSDSLEERRSMFHEQVSP